MKSTVYRSLAALGAVAAITIASPLGLAHAKAGVNPAQTCATYEMLAPAETPMQAFNAKSACIVYVAQGGQPVSWLHLINVAFYSAEFLALPPAEGCVMQGEVVGLAPGSVHTISASNGYSRDNYQADTDGSLWFDVFHLTNGQVLTVSIDGASLGTYTVTC